MQTTYNRILLVAISLLVLGLGILVFSPATVSAQAPSTNPCTTVNDNSNMNALLACQLWLQTRMMALLTNPITPTNTVTPTVTITPTGTLTPTIPITPTVTPTPSPVTNIGSDGYTNVDPIPMDTSVPLYDGVPKVRKDYLRDSQEVRIYVHDGKGELGGMWTRTINPKDFNGWTVVWQGFRTLDGAQQYSLGEFQRVLDSKDANPAFPGKDPVKKITLIYGTQVVKTVDVR